MQTMRLPVQFNSVSTEIFWIQMYWIKDYVTILEPEIYYL